MPRLRVIDAALLARAKDAVRAAQVRAHLAVNRELIGLHWQLGWLILTRQQAEDCGTRGIERLSADLRAHFPG